MFIVACCLYILYCTPDVCVTLVFDLSVRQCCSSLFFFLMIRRPPRSTLDRSSAASDVYKRQVPVALSDVIAVGEVPTAEEIDILAKAGFRSILLLSLIHISEPTRPY